MEEGPSTWDPVTHVADYSGVPDPQLQPSPNVVVGAIWGVNQQIVELSLSLLSPSLPLYLSNK